ncbi:hypothetical protein COOONC_27461 [Cooperia oncophora]
MYNEEFFASRVNGSDVLDCEQEKVPDAKPSLRIRDVFNGLEPMIPLQWQVVQSRAPGCYVAPDSKILKPARTPLQKGSMPMGGDKSQIGAKKTRYQRRKEAKKRRSLQFQEKQLTSVPEVEMEEQNSFCPFGTSTEQASPAHSDVSDN